MVYIVAAAADLNAAWEWFRGVVDKYLVREIIATIPLKKKTPQKTWNLKWHF